MPLEMRKDLLAELLEGSTAGIVYADHMTGADGVAMFEAAGRMGLGGIVSKRKDKPYCSAPAHWVKVKNPDAPWKARLEEP